MTRIRILRRAVEELERWIERARAHNPGAADALAEDVIATIERLARGEFEGTEVVLRSGTAAMTWQTNLGSNADSFSEPF